jgi:peptidoglycan/xylan/chitin deacetylase (PgdA/CDA1 family)
MDERSFFRAGRLFRAAGLATFARALDRGPGVRAFSLHGVEPDQMENFDALLALLAAAGEFITPDAFAAWIDRPLDSPLPPNGYLLTFDDGLRSSYDAAQQVLAPRGIKAIFFVPTAILGLADRAAMRRFALENVYQGWSADAVTPAMYECMSADDLVRLRAAGHLVLPHTYSHCYLPAIGDAERVEAELVRPKQTLETVLGEEVRGFAFPGGADHHAARFPYQAIRSIYDYCFTGLMGRITPKTEKHYLCRSALHPHYPTSHVRDVVDGAYDLYYATRMRRLKAATR